jgi:peptidoglycan/xylan/chitin deacetylase (PgdA/CDA1 family)
MTAKGGLIVTTSWDDGTVDDIKLAELLNKHGIGGTFYICRASSIAGLVSESEIITLDRSCEVGAHTMNHPDLTKVSQSEASEEIHASKTYLENLLGHSISMFCYPFGRYNDTVKQMIKSSGFVGARTCDPRGFMFPRDPYRFPITLYASNGSPLMALRIWTMSRL